MKESIVYKNGEYISESDVQVSFRDLGLQRGFGVFDYFRTYNQRPFQLDWHAQQLMQSIKGMNINSSLNVDFFLEIISTLFIKNENYIHVDYEYGVKTLVTGGNNPMILVYLERLDISDYSTLSKVGAGLLVHHGQRLYPEIKSLDYRAQYIHADILHAKKCLEILYVHNNTVFESATSNIFIVKDGEIITPKESIYKGSTREYVIDFARDYGYKVREEEVFWSAFVDADEIFITASKKEVLPITYIYIGDQIHNFNIGSITKNLINIFQDKKQNL